MRQKTCAFLTNISNSFSCKHRYSGSRPHPSCRDGFQVPPGTASVNSEGRPLIEIDAWTYVRHILCVMKTVTVREAQHNFAKVLLEVEAGGQVEIVRRKKPVARLVSLGLPGRADGSVDWKDHGEQMRSLWGGKQVRGVSGVLDDLRGER